VARDERAADVGHATAHLGRRDHLEFAAESGQLARGIIMSLGKPMSTLTRPSSVVFTEDGKFSSMESMVSEVIRPKFRARC
jgi:hypothetical protein